VVSADDKIIVEMHLSGGECHDGPEGRISITSIGRDDKGIPLLMDRAYEGGEARALAVVNGIKPVVPPKKNHKAPWNTIRRNRAAPHSSGMGKKVIK